MPVFQVFLDVGVSTRLVEALEIEGIDEENPPWARGRGVGAWGRESPESQIGYPKGSLDPP